jgi:hypothetical protein
MRPPSAVLAAIGAQTSATGATAKRADPTEDELQKLTARMRREGRLK